MSIRKILLKDYKQYTKLINTTISLEYFENFINNILNKNHNIFVIELNNNLIGTGTLLLEEKLTYNGCKMAHIENILIDENFRGKGYGKKIVDYMLEYSKKHKCYRADLVCYDNVVEFYTKNNFIKYQNSLQFLFPGNFN